MDPRVKEDILALLKESLEAVRKGNYGMLKDISSHTVHDSSIFQDSDSTSVAVLIYALSKVLPRSEERVKEKVSARLSQCILSLEQEKVEEYRACQREMLEDMKTTKEEIKEYFNEVLSSSEVKKASAIYYHGISIGRAAEILGSNRWELMDYVGKTRINEEGIAGVPVEKRLIFARKLFGG